MRLVLVTIYLLTPKRCQEVYHSLIINLLQSYKFSKKIEYGINTAHKKQGEVRVSQLTSPIISTKNEIIWLKNLNQ